MATMSSVWDRTTEFIGDHRAALMPIVLLAIFAPLTLIGVLMPVLGTLGQPGNLVLGLVVLALSFITSWGGLAVTALVFDPAAGRGPAVATATRRFVPLLGLSLAMLLIAAVLVAPVGVAFALGGVDMAALAAGKAPTAAPAGMNNAALAFGGLYTLLLLPLLLVVYARFFVLVTPIIVAERRGLGAFARSFVLTRRIAWKVIGMLLLYLLISTIAGMAAKTVFGSVLRLLLGADGGPVSLASILTQGVVSAIATLFSLLAIVFIAGLYVAARGARDAIVEAA